MPHAIPRGWIPTLSLILAHLAGCSADVAPMPDAAVATRACTDALGRSTCPRGQDCYSLTLATGGTRWACAPVCTPGVEGACAAGERCVAFAARPSEGTCRPACRADADCAAGDRCDAASGRCLCRSDASCTARIGAGFACGADGACARVCGEDLDCNCGSRCDGGRCVAGCARDADCCGGATCTDGRCGPPLARGLGASCSFTSQCDAGLVCVGLARGQCVPESRNASACADDTCPAGTVCEIVHRDGSPLGARCRIPCDPADPGEPCGPYRVCRPATNDPARGRCVERCNADDDCGEYGRCDRESGQCLCASDANCAAYGPAAACATATGLCTCTPNCAGRNCGPDGCGGTCGATCPRGQACSAAGTCGAPFCGGNNFVVACPAGGACPNDSTCGSGTTCTCSAGFIARHCDGAACTTTRPCRFPDWWCERCAPDACGGTCGACPMGQRCTAGRCVTTTSTCNCTGRACGPDSCGSGSCGTCPTGQTCRSNQCETVTPTCTCAGRSCGPNSCGSGSCGACASGQSCSGGQCVTSTPTCTCAGRSCGPNSCGSGSCGACASGQSCSGGRCVSSTPTCTCAGRSCGPNSCGSGSCGTCSTGQTCSSGACVPSTPSGGATAAGCVSVISPSCNDSLRQSCWVAFQNNCAGSVNVSWRGRVSGAATIASGRTSATGWTPNELGPFVWGACYSPAVVSWSGSNYNCR